jgi:hypothetical protein
MKKILLSLFTIAFFFSLFFSKNYLIDNKNNSCGRMACHESACPNFGKTSEGTEENSFARKEYEWIKYRNPSTMSIPPGIRQKENEYVNSIRRFYKSTNIKNGYQWEFRGPQQLGGRTRALAIDYDNENIIMAGGVSGGMWKTTNGGQAWYKTTLPNQIHNVSCVVQNKAVGKRNIWYYGTGEGVAGTIPSPISSAVNLPYLGVWNQFLGDGIFKSIDNGETWTVLPSTLSNSVSVINDFDFVIELETFGTDGIMAAASNGIFRSSNGGNTWTKVLSYGTDYNSSNIEIASDGTFYASIGGIGPHNGVYKSSDGISWQKISDNNFPTSVFNTVIACAPSNPNILYSFSALQEEPKVKIFKYDGISWTDISNNYFGGMGGTYGGAMLVLKVKPDDANTIFLGTIGFHRSKDGGNTYENIADSYTCYADQQSIVFSRSNPNILIVGNDGGLYKTLNNIATPQISPGGYPSLEWIPITNNLRSTQFYTVAIDHATQGSNTIIGGMQDRGNYITQTNNFNTPWQRIVQADGGFCAISNGGEYAYSSISSTHRLVRWATSGTDQFTDITPQNTESSSWMSPLILDAHDSKIMYIAASDLTWKRGMWRNSDLTQIPQGFQSTSVNWEKMANIQLPANQIISAFGMSSALPRVLYYATNSNSQGEKNHFYKIVNPHVGQPSSQELTSPLNLDQIPTYLHCICVDPYDMNKITACLTNYGIISIYHSLDGGISWTPVAGNLEERPDGSGNGPSVRWISVLYVQGQPIYFAATSTGLFSTTRLNGMNTVWTQEGADVIGNVPVDMVDVRQSDGWVVAATCGNGVYSTYVTEISVDVENNSKIPNGFSLEQNYPNPFNPSTSIEYSISKAEHVTLKVYDLLGREIATLVDEKQPTGKYQAFFETKNYSSGIYFYKIQAGDFNEVKKMILVK